MVLSAEELRAVLDREREEREKIAKSAYRKEINKQKIGSGVSLPNVDTGLGDFWSDLGDSL